MRSEIISQNRYLFTHSWAYQFPKNDRFVYQMKEIVKVIPVFSLVDCTELYKTIKNRKIWHDHKHEGCVYDVRFSSLVIALHAVNIIGLGILFIPLRIIATYMKNEDKNLKCINPHFLDEDRMDLCEILTKYQLKVFKSLLKKHPDNEDYCFRMAFRDHVEYPGFAYVSIFPDPLAKSSDPKRKGINTKN